MNAMDNRAIVYYPPPLRGSEEKEPSLSMQFFLREAELDQMRMTHVKKSPIAAESDDSNDGTNHTEKLSTLRTWPMDDKASLDLEMMNSLTFRGKSDEGTGKQG